MSSYSNSIIAPFIRQMSATQDNEEEAAEQRRSKTNLERIQEEVSRLSPKELAKLTLSNDVSVVTEQLYGLVAIDDTTAVFALYTPMRNDNDTGYCGTPIIVKRTSLKRDSVDASQRIVYGCIDVFSRLPSSSAAAATMPALLPSVGHLFVASTHSSSLGCRVRDELPTSFGAITTVHFVSVGGGAGIVEMIRDELGIGDVPIPDETCEFTAEVFERRRHNSLAAASRSDGGATTCSIA